MAQPPTRQVMSRGLVRAIPFANCKTFPSQVLATGTSLIAEFDTIAGFADPNQFQTAGAYPGTNTAKPHAVGPWLDALVFGDTALSLSVEFAVDRGCSYRGIAPATVIAASTPINIGGLRITGRFVRVTLTNNSGGNSNVEFGVYVRSA